MFDLNDRQIQKLHTWLVHHNTECKFVLDARASVNDGPVSTFPGRLEYNFKPVPLGMITNVKCMCGCKLQLTEFGE